MRVFRDWHSGELWGFTDDDLVRVDGQKVVINGPLLFGNRVVFANVLRLLETSDDDVQARTSA